MGNSASAMAAVAPRWSTAQFEAARKAIGFGMAAAIVWTLFGAESFVRPGQHNERDLFWMLPFSLTTVAFVFLHRLQASPERRFERTAFVTLMIASGLVFLGNVGLVTETKALQMLAFPLGALLWLLALTMYGIATWRAHVLPWWAGLTFILLEPGSMLFGFAFRNVAGLSERGGYSGCVEKGIAVAIIFYGVIHARKRALEQQQSQP